MRTSFAFGGATSTSSMENGVPCSQIMAALHLITWKIGYGAERETLWLNNLMIIRRFNAVLHSSQKKKKIIA